MIDDRWDRLRPTTPPEWLTEEGRRRVPAPAEPLVVEPADWCFAHDPLYEIILAVQLPGTDAIVETRWRVRQGDDWPERHLDTWTRNWLKTATLSLTRLAGPGETDPGFDLSPTARLGRLAREDLGQRVAAVRQRHGTVATGWSLADIDALLGVVDRLEPGLADRLEEIALRLADAIGGLEAPAPAGDPSPKTATAASAASLLHERHLLTDNLRATPGGRWDARAIAAALGFTVDELGVALGLPPGEAVHDPTGEHLQAGLLEYAQVIGILRSVHAGDTDSIRTWLTTPRQELRGHTPAEALRTRGAVEGVRQWLTRMWLGQPE